MGLFWGKLLRRNLGLIFSIDIQIGCVFNIQQVFNVAIYGI